MYIHVKARPGSKREEVKKASADHYEISVKEPAERNLANGRILEIVCNLFPGRTVRLMNGHNSPSKLFSIGDLEDIRP